MEESLVPLSIFNSNNYISKSILLTLLFLFVYSIFLNFLRPEITAFQNQWISNYSKAESYIYKSSSSDIIIVGSSMSFRMKKEGFDDNIFNLSFNGGSVLTGLQIIKKSKNIPTLILIETNLVEREENNDMLDSLFTPFIWHVKKYFKAAQYTYQPANIFLSIIKNKYGAKNNKTNVKTSQKILNVELTRQLKAESNIEGLEDSNEIETLQKLVNDFYSEGVTIAFFQMPVNSQLITSERYKKREQILHEIFSDLDIEWLSIPPNLDDRFLTRDGIHLTEKSASEFSKELNKHIKNMRLRH